MFEKQKPVIDEKSEHFIIDTNKCTACNSCVLACNFHHYGSFGTMGSSIHIDYLADVSKINIRFDKTCDLCKGEPIPLCVKYCATKAIQAN